MGLLRKNTVRGNNAGASAAVRYPDELGSCPALLEFLTSTVWDEDGSRRETGTLLFFADAAGLKVMMNDRDGSRVAFAVLDPSEGILESLEAMLLDTSTDWRPAKKFGGSSKKS